MNNMLWQEWLTDFHRAMNQPVGYGEAPAIRDAELRKALIKEECDELLKAITEGDLIQSIDGICDLLYVVIGTAVAFGVNIAPFFAEVHRCNMEKTTGPVRADGKRLKPEGWQPPRIKELLALGEAVRTGNFGEKQNVE